MRMNSKIEIKSHSFLLSHLISHSNYFCVCYHNVLCIYEGMLILFFSIKKTLFLVGTALSLKNIC